MKLKEVVERLECMREDRQKGYEDSVGYKEFIEDPDATALRVARNVVNFKVKNDDSEYEDLGNRYAEKRILSFISEKGPIERNRLLGLLGDVDFDLQRLIFKGFLFLKTVADKGEGFTQFYKITKFGEAALNQTVDTERLENLNDIDILLTVLKRLNMDVFSYNEMLEAIKCLDGPKFLSGGLSYKTIQTQILFREALEMGRVKSIGGGKYRLV